MSTIYNSNIIGVNYKKTRINVHCDCNNAKLHFTSNNIFNFILIGQLVWQLYAIVIRRAIIAEIIALTCTIIHGKFRKDILSIKKNFNITIKIKVKTISVYIMV